MQPYVTGTSLVLVILPIVVAGILCVSALMIRNRVPSGWKALRPSGAQVATCFASIALAGLILWVWSYVGSSRSDGAFQMSVAWWLAFLFAVGAGLVAFQVFRIAIAKISWKGDQVIVGRRKARSLRDVQEIRNSTLRGTRLTFKDGFVLPVDMQAHGANELLQHTYKLKGMVDFLDPPEH